MRAQMKGFGEVFSRFNYIVLAFVFALVFYLITVIISDFSDLKVIFIGNGFYFSLRLLVAYFIGFPSTITFSSALSMFFIALLFGSYIALALYKAKQIKSFQYKHSFFGSAGIFLGVLAPGCAACGIGVASLAGLGGFLITLPFKGLEISILALLLLGYANWSVAGKINKNTCLIDNKLV